MAPQQDRIPHQRPRMQPHNMGRQHHTNRQQLHRTTTNDQRPHPRHHGRRILLEGRRNTGSRRLIRQTRRHRNLDLRQRRPPPTRNPSRQIRPRPPRNTTTPHRQHPPKHRTPTTQSGSNILETLPPNQKQRRQCQIQTQTMDLNRHEVSNVRLRILALGRNNPHKNKIMGITLPTQTTSYTTRKRHQHILRIIRNILRRHPQQDPHATPSTHSHRGNPKTHTPHHHTPRQR